MKQLRYTLLSDGSSDNAALLPILTWLLRENGVTTAIEALWAELRHLPTPPRSLPQRIRTGLHYYPCDLLFVHRDAEKQPYSTRKAEVERAIESVARGSVIPPAVCVIPVRMQEAWLLIDEEAIRSAAGNPNGKQPLSLPPISRLEDLPDPKRELHELMCEASGLSGRRRKRSQVRSLTRRVAGFIMDFAPLRRLSAFNALETDLSETVLLHGWGDKRL